MVDDDYILMVFRSADKNFEKVLAPENEKFMRVIYNNDITEADILKKLILIIKKKIENPL